MKRIEKIALENYPIYEFSSKDINRRDRNIFLQGYEQAEKNTIKRVVQWLEQVRIRDYQDIEDGTIDMEQLISDLKNAMKED